MKPKLFEIMIHLNWVINLWIPRCVAFNAYVFTELKYQDGWEIINLSNYPVLYTLYDQLTNIEGMSKIMFSEAMCTTFKVL